jgi:large subunit ribosomal protein L28
VYYIKGKSKRRLRIKHAYVNIIKSVLNIVQYFFFSWEVLKMAKRCEVCGKDPATGNAVSHSHILNKRRWLPNIQKVRANINGTVKRINVCTRCLKSGKVKRAI